MRTRSCAERYSGCWGYSEAHLGRAPTGSVTGFLESARQLNDSGKIKVVRHDGSDVKAPWELSRLQWSPVVAKAYVLTGDRSYREVLRSLITEWVTRNPLGKGGANWTIALEAALRGINLCLTMDLLWPFGDDEKPWLDQMTASLWLHLRLVELHQRVFFSGVQQSLLEQHHRTNNYVCISPGTRDRVDGLKGAARCVQEREILLQTYADGGDVEASTGYHVLVAQMFLHSLVVQQRTRGVIAPRVETRLRLMFDWIASLSDDAGRLPHIGDCHDGGSRLLLEDIAQTNLPVGERRLPAGGGTYVP